MLEHSSLVIDEAHKLPEAARQMFGVTLCAGDIQAMIRDLRTEHYLLAAETLAECSGPISRKLAEPWDEERSLDVFLRLLIMPNRSLRIIQRQLGSSLTAVSQSKLESLAAAVSLLCDGNPDMVFYTMANEHGNTDLCATISNLTAQLRSVLWEKPGGMVLTSGTIAVGHNFQRYKAEIGLSADDRVDETVSLSPFDYRRNCLLYFPLRPPKHRSQDYYDRLTDEITALIKAAYGHALVLFTSYAAMSAVKERLAERDLIRPLFMMGRNAVHTTEQFKSRPGSVLLATGAAWEGFDFPGDGVSLLIIPRLPFPHPDVMKEKERKGYPTLRAYIRAVVIPEKRKDFQQLLSDCRRGLVDKILCKSMSRFARNTKECLEIIRELKNLGIGVCFEKENINTATMSGEMLTALFAAMAQAESESIFGNMRWSYQKRMQDGTFLPSSVPYGYVIKESKIVIDKDQAAIVREIFDYYLHGMNMREIAHRLNERNIPPTHSTAKWRMTAVRYILHNERYIGDSLWQKTYMTDTFPPLMVRNRGEWEMYYAKETHPPIISREIFDAVQILMQKRRDEKSEQQSYANSSITLCPIICGECGTSFRIKRVRGKVYWCCRLHAKSKESCSMQEIGMDEIHCAFLRFYYRLKHQGVAVLTQMVNDLQAVRRRRMLWSADVIALNKQISSITSQNQLLTMLKQQGGVDPDIFISRSNTLAEQLRTVKQEKERLLNAEGDTTIARTLELIEIIESGPDFLEEFDRDLFGELVDQIIVDSNEHLRFRLKKDLELSESVERSVR